MTTKSQDVDAPEESGGSIGFLRASEKMWISTFEIPLVFLEDMGFSKERIQAAKDFNRRFVSGFYGRVRKVGDKLSFGHQSSRDATDEISAAEKNESWKGAKAREDAAAAQAKPATPAATAKKQMPVSQNVPSNTGD